MFEKRHEPVIQRVAFIKRMVRNLLMGFAIIIFSLMMGMLGYLYFEKMSLVDAFVNAAMILSGMGAVSSLKTEAGKIFVGLYALFSGVIFLAVIAIIFAPIIHRFLHKFLVKD